MNAYIENRVSKTITQNITVIQKVIAKGDINNDGQINTLDRIKILRYISETKDNTAAEIHSD